MDFLRRIMAQFAIGLLAAYATLAVFSVFLANYLLFPKVPPSYDRKSEFIRLPVEGVGEIACVYLQNVRSQYVIFYAHGNGEDLGHTMARLQMYYRAGFSVFAYDYPGYGASDGAASEKTVIASTDAAYAYMTERLQIPKETIIAYGRSVGGGPMVDLAAREPMLGGLILEATFASAFRVKTHVPIVPWDIFNNSRKMPHVKCPVLIIHGTNDHVISFWHSQELLERTQSPKLFLWAEGGGHNNLQETLGETYWEMLNRFLSLVDSNRQVRERSKT